MSVTLFARYLYFDFWDYPGILIIPFFALAAAIYFFKAKNKDTKLKVVIILYLLMVVPLFDSHFLNGPRQYFPPELLNKHDFSDVVPVELPYDFEHEETERLSIKAFELFKVNQYQASIRIYKKALKIEPRNPSLLFGMAEAYEGIGKLEEAILLLDKAIEEDSSYAPFFNNRGLYYYKLSKNSLALADYKKAIELDSTESTYYANLALVYHYQNKPFKSCEAIKIAEQLGLKLSNLKILKDVKSKNCK